MNTTVPQILIPIDFSDQSLLALERSPGLTRFYKAELTLLYVIEYGTALTKVLKIKNGEAAFKKEIQHKLDVLAEGIAKKQAVKVNTLITKGRIYNEILKTAEKINAKLIMMGTYGTTHGLPKRLIGSNAYKVVRASECPVITIKGKNIRKEWKSILLPIDLTAESREKVKNAIALGKLYGATIHVVYILSTLDEDAAFRLTKQVEQVRKFIEKAGVKCSTKVVSPVEEDETTSQAIINHAREIEADLIMMMTQQEGEYMKPLFIGSTAQDIINNSDIPVMSIVPSVKPCLVAFAPY